MRNWLVVCLCVTGLVFGASAWAQDDEWDYEDETNTDMAGNWFCNPCADPPEALELTAGVHHSVMKNRKQLDDEGNLVGWDIRLHSNHQGAKATGYDLVTDADGNMLDEDGNIVTKCGEAARLKDENGDYITTEYSIPGHYQYTQNISRQGDHGEATEIFMCHMISHGEEENALVHYNGHIVVNVEDGSMEFTVDKDNLWCKCTGPDSDGEAQCDEWPDNCIDLLLY